MMEARESNAMSDYLFGLHPGHLGEQADRIARRRGGWHVNHTEPSGEQRGWFAVPDRGSPFDELAAAEILAAVERAGGMKALSNR